MLSSALRVASQRRRVARNVAALVDPPAVTRPITELPLSAEEAREVRATAEAHRNAARWTVALVIGFGDAPVVHVAISSARSSATST